MKNDNNNKAEADLNTLAASDLVAQSGALIAALFAAAAEAGTEPDARRTRFSRMLENLRLPAIEAVPASQHGLFPGALLIACRSKAALMHFLAELTGAPFGRLAQAQAACQFKSVILVYGTERHLLPLRTTEVSNNSPVKQRNLQIRKALAPLFDETGESAVIDRHMLDEFVALVESSPRLREKVEQADWLLDSQGIRLSPKPR